MINQTETDPTAVWLKLKAYVLGQYGGKCCCCGEQNISTLVLVYEDRALLEAEENRKVGQGTLEYLYLYRNGCPQNGRKVACRRCIRHANTDRFPEKCSFNHQNDRVLPKFVDFNPEAAEEARKKFEADGFTMDMIRGPKLIFRLKARTLSDPEQRWQALYRVEIQKIYRRQRARLEAKRIAGVLATTAETVSTAPSSISELVLDPEDLNLLALQNVAPAEVASLEDEIPDMSDWEPSPDQ
jgi:hypothetical protein